MIEFFKELFYIVKNYRKNRENDDRYYMKLLHELDLRKVNKPAEEINAIIEERNKRLSQMGQKNESTQTH